MLELLVVIAIIAILMVLVAPAFTNLKRANDMTAAAYTITGMMEQARNLSISKNTYVWLGFYEEDVTATNPNTSATPPYPGKGRLVLATVYSNDGTEIISPTTSGSNPLPASRITQFGKLTKIDNVHMTDIGSPTPAPSASPNSLDSRSSMPYSSPSAALSSTNRLSSDSTHATRFQFTVQGYTFWKTIRFTPRGEARLNTSYDYRRFAELGLAPTHGNTIDTNDPNVIAIQFSAFDGDFKIFRR